MSDKYLIDWLDDIEKNNQTNFKDPFFQLHQIMSDFYNNYFTYKSLGESSGDVNQFLAHVDEIIEIVDGISHNYVETEAEYHRWRINSFERMLFKALSKEAATIGDMILQILHDYDQLDYDTLNDNDLVSIAKAYTRVVKRVYISSRRVTEYQLENLW
jgi:hypothetical protein